MSLMNWKECEKDFIRKAEPDLERAEAISEKAIRRLERARNGKETDFIVEDYYEAIKEFLTAYLLRSGLRSKNHQCLISFFYMKNPTLEFEANLIQQMSFFRNRLEYYGESIPKEFYIKNKAEFENVIKIIRKLMEK
jgi:uncharacterized protein (UPF0332 family)